ncbi:MAG: hypothetical protein ABJC09_06810 [Terriglobia bacterium]
MTPADLDTSSFSRYPPQAAAWCARRIGLLKRLPLAVAPSIFEQAIAFDWKFPAEKVRLTGQISALAALAPAAFDRVVAPLEAITLPEALAKSDWVNHPAVFVETLTAHLWSTGQIDRYREAARTLLDSAPVEAEPVRKRTVIFLAGAALTAPSYPLFERLRASGLHAVDVAHDAEQTWALELLAKNASATEDRYANWYLDGGEPWPLPPAAGPIITLSYAHLDPVRKAVLYRMNRATRAGDGPELLHRQLVAMQPEECGAQTLTPDPVLQHFMVDLFTQGSGTQIYSTTFVQWAAREILRRASPQTLVVRVAPRVRQRGLNELIATPGLNPDLDAAGSLVDADMAAYYTWLELQKLPGAADCIFLAWFQGRGEAFLTGPSIPRNVTASSRMTIDDVYGLLS